MHSHARMVAVTALFFAPGTGPVLVDGGTEAYKLLPDDGAPADVFGRSVAIDGTLIAVGAFGNGGAGSAYVFDSASQSQVAKLVALDGAVGDNFGTSVALRGSIVLVGAYRDDDNGLDSGSAYLFDANTGVQLAKLLPADGATGDWFGFSVALIGTTAIVGAYRDGDNGYQSGSVFLFDTTTGAQTAKLLAADGVAQDWFGYSVAANDTELLIGALGDDDRGNASGSAYLFDAATGLQLEKLLPANEASLEFFGFSVALNNSTAVIGAYGDDHLGTLAGAAYLFDVQSGARIAKIQASDGEAHDYFGYSVAISGTTAIVGAYQDDDRGVDSGSVYLFDAHSGTQLAKLRTDDGAAADFFGRAVAASQSSLIAGATGDDENGQSSGSAYVFAFDRASASIRNGSGTNALLLASIAPPALGRQWVTTTNCAGHAASAVILLVYLLPSSGNYVRGGEVLVDLASPLLLRASQLHTGNVVSFSFLVPDEVSVCGQSATAQSVVLGAPGYELSNALQLTIGL